METEKSAYPVRVLGIMDLIGDKWSLFVTHNLGDRAMRFSDLKRASSPISSKMLTQTLRGLERFGMIRREVISTMPPSVEYSLTELGRSFYAAAQVICTWTLDNVDALEDACHTFNAEILA